MNAMRIPFTFVLLAFQTVFSQAPYPTDTFRPPLDIPLLLSGSFGELRSNHFHSGLDIKTQQREGLPVYAIADGHVNRIAVKHFGYGKALYIDHGNGYSSVYAHLQRFAPEIEAYVKKHQYQKETYEIELFPTPSELRLEKGQIIAYSGNSGGSGGPHLHFEIRDSKTEKPINPLLFGFDVKDTQAPGIETLLAYSLADSTHVNQTNYPVQINFTRQKDGTFLADKMVAHGTIGFGINAFDRQDLSYNKNGLYSLEMSVNGTPHLNYSFETFSFSETIYINTFIDYERLVSRKQHVQQLFIKPSNKLGIYGQKVNNGFINVEDGMFYSVTLTLKDAANNATVLTIPVEGKKLPIIKASEAVKTNNYLIASRDNIYNIGNANIYFPEGTFYEDFFIDLKQEDSTVIIHNNKVARHKNYTLTFNVSNYPDTLKPHLVIVNISDKGKLDAESTYRSNNSISTKTKSMGRFGIAIDTTPPTVTPANFKADQWLSNFKYLKIKIADNLSGIKSYRATINGKFILTEYEYKQKMLTYDFADLTFEGSQHNLEVVVTDNAGNSTTFKTTFYRKL